MADEDQKSGQRGSSRSKGDESKSRSSRNGGRSRPGSGDSKRDGGSGGRPRRRRRGRGPRNRGPNHPNPNHPNPNQGVDGDMGEEAVLATAETLVEKEGLIELMDDGYGFIRFPENTYLPDDNDVYVSANVIRKYSIRNGCMIKAEAAPPTRRGQKDSVVKILSINDKDPELHAEETLFKQLLPLDPDDRFLLEDHENPDISMRIIDLLAPIGKGQRALIVSPPRAGKTVILQKMANAISACDPEAVIIILLIDERPEEVTDMKRSTNAEVIASCLDEATANHVRVTEVILAKMKRLVEAGKDVVCLLDSITRLGRAYNNETKHSGRILSGGVDAKTLAKPKAFFGAARNVEDGGSLTIIATALVDTGSRMDQVIFEEFKGTGNMELVLSRQLAESRIFPAIDIPLTGTRKEEKLFHPDEHEKVNVLRRVLNQLNPTEAMRLLIDRMEKTVSNAEFLAKFDVGDE